MPRSFAATPPKILLHPANDQGGGQYRILQPASLLRKHGYAVTQANPHPLSPEALRILDPDIVVFQLVQLEHHQEQIKQYRKVLKNAFFIYEIDDLFWEVPEGSFHRSNPILPHSKQRITATAKLCDAVTTTTPELAEALKRATGVKDIRVAPNYITRQFLNTALAARRKASEVKHDKPRVGWAGGIGHGGDLAIIADVMKAIGDEVTWVFFGLVPPGVDPNSVEFHPGVTFDQYPELLGSLNLDLALAPLEDNVFNRCKSNLRLLEYGAAGFPVIASDVAPYRSSDYPVVVTKNEVSSWVNLIRELLSNARARELRAEDLHNWVANHNLLDNHLASHVKALLPRNSEPFDPTISTNAQKVVVAAGGSVRAGQSQIQDLINPAVVVADNFASIREAWKAVPGANIIYMRDGTELNYDQISRMLDQLGRNASVSALSNDSGYPTPEQFTPLPTKISERLDQAAKITQNEPISCPFPYGPCVLMSGTALYRFGLPDETRFPEIQQALAEWGTRCMEGGVGHVSATNVFVRTESAPKIQAKSMNEMFEHISMWTPGVQQAIAAYKADNTVAVRRENLELAYHALHYTNVGVTEYQEWIDAFDTPTQWHWEKMQKEVDSWEHKPAFISIIMPVYNPDPDHLQAAINSVFNQTYPNCELIICDDASTDPRISILLDNYNRWGSRVKVVRRSENGHICNASNTALEHATGDWVCFLDHDDVLAPHAMFAIAKALQQHPEVQFVYSDSDKLAPQGNRIDPYFAPDFSYELLLAQNYVTHLCAYRLEAVKAIGCLRPGFEGSQDWDLVLRYLEYTCGHPPNPQLIHHIPAILYHWRMHPNSTSMSIASKPYAMEAGVRAVREHLSRRKELAFIGSNPLAPIFVMTRFLVPDPAPKVTVIIPTKDSPENLGRCIGSLLSRTVYGNYNVVILDNGVSGNARSAVNGAKDKIRVIPIPGPFNFAAANNRAVREAVDAEFVCLLNDDTEVLEPGWLNDLVGIALREKVGAVGPKLLYPDNTVQQCGIIFSADQEPLQSAIHLWQRLPVNHPGQMGRAVITQPYLAVTGACLVIRRQLYLDMGGMDEVRFPLDYNDVDLCLRLHKAGYRNIVSAQALIRHYEGTTKKKSNAVTKEMVREAEKLLLELHSDVRDPYINANLAFHPHLACLKTPPTPVWEEDVEDRDRVLVVNGTAKEAIELYRNGSIPYCVTLTGHYMHFTYPEMRHVEAVDLRLDLQRLAFLIQVLRISRIIFCGIGEGTLGAVGYFATIAEKGFPVEFCPTETAKYENDLGYYDQAGWQNAWNRFTSATSQLSAA